MNDLATLAGWPRSEILRQLSPYEIQRIINLARRGDPYARAVAAKILSCCDDCGEHPHEEPCGGHGSGCNMPQTAGCSRPNPMLGTGGCNRG